MNRNRRHFGERRILRGILKCVGSKIRKMCIIKTFKNWSFVIHQTSKICHISNVLISHATNVLNFHKYLFYAENHGIVTDVELNIDHEIYFECHKIY